MRPPLALLLLPLLTSPLQAQPAQPGPDFSELENAALDEMTATGTLLLRSNDQLPVTQIGEHRFRVTPKEGKPQELLIFPAAEGRPGYVQRSLWVYRKD